MAKETMKAKIEWLEHENAEYIQLNLRLNQEIADMQEKADLAFIKSNHQIQLEQKLAFQTKKAETYESRLNFEKEKSAARIAKIEELDAKNKRLKDEIIRLNEKADKNTHNVRNAGRKPKVSEKQIVEIQMMRDKGMTIQVIAKEVGLSYGLVQKYCKIIKN